MIRGPGGLTAAGAVAAVAASSTTVASLLADCWSRMDRWEPTLGAVVARVDAPSETPSGPLAGVLFGVKDSILVRDGASVARHATVVQRLVDAGAVPVARLAKAGPDAPGGMTPGTGNPLAPARVSGGSSGGSAAAVAAGLVHVALGADAGGSIRIPAACCGVVGLKPTTGLVPLTGVASPTYALDAVGPLARTVADLRLVLQVIAGHDAADPSSVPLEADTRSVPLGDPLRVGVPIQFVRSPVDAVVRAAWGDTTSGLAAGGAVVSEVDIPMLGQALAVARTLGAAESAAVLLDAWTGTPEPLPDAVERRIRRGHDISGALVARSYQMRARLVRELAAVFDDVDVLLTPTLPCRVPVIGDDDHEVDIVVEGVQEPRVDALTRFVNPWNLTGSPAGTVPVGVDDGGGSIAVQVVGRRFDDGLVLDVLEAIERRLATARDRDGRSSVPKHKNT